MNHNSLIGKLVILLLAFVVADGCKERDGGEFATSVTIPDVTSLAGSQDPARILRTIEIKPYGARLSRDNLMAIGIVMQQMASMTAADSGPPPILPVDTDLYASLRSSFHDKPGWSVLEFQANKQRGLELYAIVAFIESTEGRSN
jgi:hypothetical protein